MGEKRKDSWYNRFAQCVCTGNSHEIYAAGSRMSSAASGRSSRVSSAPSNPNSNVSGRRERDVRHRRIGKFRKGI